MSDILAELDEVMHQERVEKFFKTYGKFVLAAAVGIVIMTGTIAGYKSWNASVNAAGTDALLALLEAENFPENMQTATLDMRAGLRGIGLLTAAGAFLDQSKTEEALDLYKRASADEAIPDDLRALAILMQTRLDETSDATAIQPMLMKIWSNKKNPWRYHARLEAAALLANKQQDYKGAREHLNVIQDAAGLPKTLYNTASSLDQIYAIRQQEARKESSDEK